MNVVRPDDECFPGDAKGGNRVGSTAAPTWRFVSRLVLAMAIASDDSVTVSIAAESSGIFNEIFLVRRVLKTVSLGRTAE